MKSAVSRSLPGQTRSATPGQVFDPHWDMVERLPMRRIGFFLTLCFLFLRVTALHELLATTLGVNTRILYLFGPPAILCAFLSGGFQRTFRHRQAQLWLGLLAFLYVSCIFSYWRADSIRIAFTYTRTEIMMLPLLAGLAYSMKDFWRLMMTLAIAGFANIILAMIFVSEISGGRTERDFGTMANANDFAAHLTFMLPFIALVLFTRRHFVIRAAAAAMMAVGLYQILSTGSRGALVALLVACGFTFLRASIRQKVILLVGTFLVGFTLMALLPDTVANRLNSMFKGTEDEIMTGGMEAFESRMSRIHLLKRSLALTAMHPILGVGPGQFMYSENEDAKERTGKKGSWHVTHNTYTEVSSELGLPATFFYIGAIVSTFFLLNRVHRKALSQPPSPLNSRIVIASYCILVTLVGFGAACFFLSLAYFYYFPLLTGMALVLARAAEHEWQRVEWEKANAGPPPSLPQSPAFPNRWSSPTRMR